MAPGIRTHRVREHQYAGGIVAFFIVTKSTLPRHTHDKTKLEYRGKKRTKVSHFTFGPFSSHRRHLRTTDRWNPHLEAARVRNWRLRSPTLSLGNLPGAFPFNANRNGRARLQRRSLVIADAEANGHRLPEPSAEMYAQTASQNLNASGPSNHLKRKAENSAGKSGFLLDPVA
jgi:hypothetical protein